MIPKIIHYCWFGKKEKPAKIKKLIKKRKKKLPDYKFMEWNEENFDINSSKFTKIAYEMHKYAFVSDYVRLYALINFGGIYLDTDVIVVKNFDSFLSDRAFLSFESNKTLCTAVIGSQKDNPFLIKCFDHYRKFNEDTLDLTPNSQLLFNFLNISNADKNNVVRLENITVYPVDYFCAKDFKTYESLKTENTVTIHLLDGSWYSPFKKFLKFIKKIFVFFGLGFLWKNRS